MVSFISTHHMPLAHLILKNPAKTQFATTFLMTAFGGGDRGCGIDNRGSRLECLREQVEVNANKVESKLCWKICVIWWVLGDMCELCAYGGAHVGGSLWVWQEAPMHGQGVISDEQCEKYIFSLGTRHSHWTKTLRNPKTTDFTLNGTCWGHICTMHGFCESIFTTRSHTNGPSRGYRGCHESVAQISSWEHSICINVVQVPIFLRTLWNIH